MMWENTAEPDRPRTTIWRMCVASCINRATTHSVIKNYCLSITSKVAGTRLNFTLMYTVRLSVLALCSIISSTEHQAN